jgi:hypothetical protein
MPGDSATTYGVWGNVLVQSIFNETSLTKLIGSAMAPQTVKEAIPGTSFPMAEGTATPKLVGNITAVPGGDPCEAHFTGNLGIDLKLKLVGSVPYEGTAKVKIGLTVRAEAPATLILDLVARNIEFEGKNNDTLLAAAAAVLTAIVSAGWSLVAFGSVEAILTVLKNTIRDKVFEKIKKTLLDTAPQTHVDLFNLVKSSQASGQPVLTNDIKLPAPLVGAGTELILDLQKLPSYFDVLLNAGEQIGLLVSLLVPQHNDDRLDAFVDPAVTLDVKAYAPDNPGPVWEEDDWSMGTLPQMMETDARQFTARLSARYRIEISGKGRTLPKISIRQKRIAGPQQHAARICFPDVGRDVLLGALGPDVIADAISAALSGIKPQDLTTDKGPLHIVAIPKNPMVSQASADGTSLRFPIVLTLDITGTILNQTWKALPKANIVLLVKPEIEPLALSMSFDGTPKVTLDARDVSHPGEPDNVIRDAVRDAIVKFLPGIVADQLSATLNDQKLRDKMYVNLKKMIDDGIAQRAADMAKPVTPPAPMTALPYHVKAQVSINSKWSIPVRLDPGTDESKPVRFTIKHRYPPGTKEQPAKWKDIMSLDRVLPALYICDDRGIPLNDERIQMTVVGDEDAWNTSVGKLEPRYSYAGDYVLTVYTGNVPVECEITVSK